MRLSIREEVAYNRIVTELRETAISEALAEIELENMIVEMEEYLSWTTDNSTQKETVREKSKKEEVLEEKNEACTKNDEVCRMLDDVERELMVKNSDGSSVPVNDEIACKNGVELNDITTATKTVKNREDKLDTSRRCEQERKKLEHLEEDMERISTVEIISSALSDMNGNKTTFKCIDKPRKTQKRRYLSIFTRRYKNKTLQETEKKASSTPEEKTKNGGSFLTSFKRLFCCYTPKN